MLNGGGKYSGQSQHSLLQRDKLGATLADLNHKAEAIENQIAAGEAEKERLGKAVLAGGGLYVEQKFKEACERVTERRETLRICRGQCVKAQAEIGGVTPTPEQQKARAERQEEFARLAADRLEKDRRAHNLLKDLRSLLEKRVELTARMAECAADIDLTLAEDGLDAARVEGLLSALPAGLAEASEDWYARFLGKQNGLRCHIVRDDRLVLPETLASHGVYYFSDCVKLTEDQARQFLREDGSAPPSIMTFGEHLAVMAKAGMRGVSIREICFWEDVQRAVAVRKEQASKSLVPGLILQNVPAYKSNGFVGDLRIRATVKSPIKGYGREYEKGDSIEVPGKPETWNLALLGIIGPPWEG